MPTHVALLRGVNVGGRKVAMADLRQLVADLGHTDVATYVSSGNVVFSADPAAAIAAELEAAIEARTGVSTQVVVLTRDGLADAVANNPYPDESNPKNLHAVFRATPFGADDDAALTDAHRRARERGSTGEEATIVDGVLYLHLPGGIGRSELASQLTRTVSGEGTARNWSTVTKLLALLDG